MQLQYVKVNSKSIQSQYRLFKVEHHSLSKRQRMNRSYFSTKAAVMQASTAGRSSDKAGGVERLTDLAHRICRALH